MASNVPDEPSNGPGEPSNALGEPKAKGETSLQSKFEAQRNKLEEIVESRFGLLSLLWSSKALTPTDQEEIEGKYTTKSKNQKLLDLISEKGNYQEFIDALRGSGQTHVVNWINGNGVYKPKFDLDWPLTDKEIDILDCNYNWLGEVLGLKEGLNGTLFSRNVINVRQRDFISSKPTSCEANEAFLKTLRQSSLKIYYLTAHCLRDLNDGHIATVLENVTATVPIHVTLVGESVVETEEQILDEVVKLRLEKNASLEEGDMDIFLARLRLRLIAARKGSSIVLFVSCFNIGEFHHLCTKVDKSEMKKILERLFNLLLQNLKPRVLLVTITESDRDNAEKLFEREFLRDKRYDEHFQRLRSQLKYEEPMELTTGESVEESEGEELTQESEDLSTPAFVEGGGLISRTLNSLSTVLTSAVRLIYHWYFPFATCKRVKYRNAQEPMNVTTEESVGEMEDIQKTSELYSTSASAEGGPLFQLALQLLKELRLQFYMSKADEPKEEFYLRHKHRPMKANRKLCKWWVKTSATMTAQKISGMAMLRNRIIISIQNRSAFVIFTLDKEGNAIHEKDETFTEIKTPMHLASSLNLQCLYITDHTSNNIYQVNIDPEGKVYEPILLLKGSPVEQINSLSVGRNDNLLVLKEGEPSRLEIYDKEARKLSQLELPTQIRYPNNAVEASSGDFVISYRSDLIPSGICRINGKGVWVSRSDLDFKCRAIPGLSEDEDSVVSSLSEGIPYLKHLDHFTLDDKDQVYACSADQCVVLLDSELNMEGTVEFKDLKNPYKIHYSKDEKELLLVHGSDQDSFSVLSSRFKME